MRILVVEDNEKLGKYVKQAYEEEGYAVDLVLDGETGERMAGSGSHDLAVFDIMLPKKDGIAACKSLRESGADLPIILMTAKSAVDDRVMGLDSGADDYLVKPFDMKELLARTRALLRRPRETVPQELSVQDLVLNGASHSLTQAGSPVSLTVKEYAVLEYLMRHAGQVVTREGLIEHCWDFAFSSLSNITDVYVGQLRRKLKDNDEKYIQTVRGVGYTFRK
jgi:DNA-binding response OmpR family regulator